MILRYSSATGPVIGTFDAPDGHPHPGELIEIEGKRNWHRVVNVAWRHSSGYPADTRASLPGDPSVAKAPSYEAHVFVVEVPNLPILP